MGDTGLAGHDEATAIRALLDDEVGPLLVGLRTLEWRWEQLPAIGADPYDMLLDLVEHSSAAVKLSADAAAFDGELAVLATELHDVVLALADGIVGDDDRPSGLTRAVGLAADLFGLLERRRLALAVALRRG